MGVFAAMLFACLSVAVALPGIDTTLFRLGQGLGNQQAIGGRRRRWMVSWPLAAALAVLALVLLSGVGVEVMLLGAGSLGAFAVVRRLLASWRLRVRRRGRQRAVIELCDALAAEMRAGLPATVALERSCGLWAELASVATVARLGGDVTAAIRQAGQTPGAEGLSAVAAAWEVAARSGAALALVLERVAAGLRSDDDARSEVIAALGPPRATAKMLAALPLFGLALGVSMDAHPVQFLFHTGAGLGCLGLGVLLALLGVVWVERLAAAVEA
ncbi:MAG: type II secretion system F family protein [Nocardioidaceae bacterium]